MLACVCGRADARACPRLVPSRTVRATQRCPPTPALPPPPRTRRRVMSDSHVHKRANTGDSPVRDADYWHPATVASNTVLDATVAAAAHSHAHGATAPAPAAAAAAAAAVDAAATHAGGAPPAFVADVPAIVAAGTTTPRFAAARDSAAPRPRGLRLPRQRCVRGALRGPIPCHALGRRRAAALGPTAGAAEGLAAATRAACSPSAVQLPDSVHMVHAWRAYAGMGGLRGSCLPQAPPCWWRRWQRTLPGWGAATEWASRCASCWLRRRRSRRRSVRSRPLS